MLERVLRFFFTLIFAFVGGALLKLASPVLTVVIGTEILKMDMGILKLSLAGLLCILIGALIGGAFGYAISPYLTNLLRRFSERVERQLSKMPTHDVVAGVIGLAIGLLIANLLGYSFAKIPVVGDYIPVAFSIVFGYLGIYIMIKKWPDFVDLFNFLPKMMQEFAKMRERRAEEKEQAKRQEEEKKGKDKPSAASYKVLDTSVIIDGRIADICDTGFIEGTLLIPVFVLEELQHIADSADQLKRTRGRRGLDILQRIRTESKMTVEVTNQDFEEIAEVDSKLVALAQKVGGKIITNDFNLNKVARLRGVEVLNINELSNAVKPVVIPGESMKVTVVKSGKEPGQGVAYLDDGTMIVIEDGYRRINETIDVEVTSALQTAAGRMIFAKPVR